MHVYIICLELQKPLRLNPVKVQLWNEDATHLVHYYQISN